MLFIKEALKPKKGLKAIPKGKKLEKVNHLVSRPWGLSLKEAFVGGTPWKAKFLPILSKSSFLNGRFLEPSQNPEFRDLQSRDHWFTEVAERNPKPRAGRSSQEQAGAASSSGEQ